MPDLGWLMVQLSWNLMVSSRLYSCATLALIEQKPKRIWLSTQWEELKAIHMVLANTFLDDYCYICTDTWTFLNSLAIWSAT